jgi:outer membrane assembly lipoprotein YfiO
VTRSRSRWLRCLFVIACAALLGGCAASTIPAVHSESERLALARRMMDQKRWASAIELLKSFVQNNPGSAQIDVGHYLLGMSYLRNKDYALSSTEFEQMLRDYPESDSTPSASFRLGEAEFAQARSPDFDQEQTAKAIDQFKAYLDTYPGHWLNAEGEKQLNLARSRIASKLLATGRLYLSLKLHGPARVYFQRVRDEYGDTRLLGDALMGLAQCNALDHRVPQAIEELRDVEARFPGTELAQRAAKERGRLEHKKRS